MQWVLRWERQKRCFGRKMQGPLQRNVVIMIKKIIRGKEDKDKRMILSNLPFSGIYLKNQDIHFWCMVIPLGPHSVYT